MAITSPEGNDHSLAPLVAENAYIFVSSQPMYTVPPEGDRAGEASTTLPADVCWLHTRLPVAPINAYTYESSLPMNTYPLGATAGDDVTAAPVV